LRRDTHTALGKGVMHTRGIDVTAVPLKKVMKFCQPIALMSLSQES
jgi:hypothetical protein